MSIEDHRRRLTGSAESTGQLSVAELIARREAETVEIPVITDDITPEAFEPTIKFKSVQAGGKPKKQPMKELHITELLRREGRADDTQSGGFTVGKLAVAASGGVILCGSVAFAASSWLSSPNERPLAEVRFDERAQARGASAGTEVSLPRVSLMSGARVLAGSGWMGLRDREAFVTKGVKLTPMFTGFLALAALLALMAMAWWREGR